MFLEGKELPMIGLLLAGAVHLCLHLFRGGSIELFDKLLNLFRLYLSMWL